MSTGTVNLRSGNFVSRPSLDPGEAAGLDGHVPTTYQQRCLILALLDNLPPSASAVAVGGIPDIHSAYFAAVCRSIPRALAMAYGVSPLATSAIFWRSSIPSLGRPLGRRAGERNDVVNQVTRLPKISRCLLFPSSAVVPWQSAELVI